MVPTQFKLIQKSELHSGNNYIPERRFHTKRNYQPHEQQYYMRANLDLSMPET
eukprot:CAMPEP_0170560620 /NCGR_PEP_ID=MMETSP0211-20121228/49973_1 /TAXON_ID=311385 /ORGANISM="Pseudokeronopsis sp., Strain OXSARD2" /LENGTH=52 /DNA_ID=CAMNT_0010875045 /DNA_START=484 /DNA_END=642 /DNA_ORIENTATION=-